MDGYSRLVSILKVVLPLAALALLSTLFLLSRNMGSDAVLPFSQHEVEGRLRSEQITGPFFAGMTESGDDIYVSAEIARPGDDDTGAELDQMQGRILFAGGGEMRMSALTGTVQPESDSVRFSGDVHIQTQSGYELRTETLFTALNRVAANAPTKVFGTGPIGQIEAGAMTLQSHTESKRIHMLFNNGVKLVYDPKQSER